jgi:hypothetical protein
VKQRLKEEGVRLEDFGNSFLVVCPKCSGRATVIDRGAGIKPQIILTCAACGRSETWRCLGPGVMYSTDQGNYRPGHVCVGAAFDWYFHLPLWLQLPCCGETLWAYNAAHLGFLESYVGAVLRERRRDENDGWSNQSLASRLPAWMKVAKHRTEIMKCLSKLRERVV